MKLLYSFFLWQLRDLSSFYKATRIPVLENPFLLLDIQGQIHLLQLVWEYMDDSFYIFKDRIMSFSFFMGGPMKDITTIVNHHKMSLYSVYFLLARIEYFSFILIDSRFWYLLFCGIYERPKAWKIFSISSDVRNLFVIPYIFRGMGTHCLLIFNIQSFICLYKCYSNLNQRESQPKCRLCKDDNIPKASKYVSYI